ncbi:MAG: prohibitin family protein [Proteobacteria bacterium]|nr:prohibitin family protein [Pseudomonadota bacterium]MBU1715013.1 prohibitin family protein [Pseudomonadota bacterium]
MVSTLLLLFVIVYFWQSIFITIHAGEAGVLYRRFGGGTVVDRVYNEGLHVVAPVNIMTVYNVRLQTVAHQMEVLSSKGLMVTLSLSIRYRPERQVLGVLHQEVGPDYLHRIILPEVEAKLRAILGQYEAEEIYTSKRGVVQEVVNESLAQVSQRFVLIDNVMITNIELPAKIRAAIESKLVEQQLAAAYEFRLIREEKEAERKRIEAGGIKTYNNIVNLSLNERLLQWKGVEATLELSKSPNSKVVIIGSGKDGLPVILNTNN